MLKYSKHKLPRVRFSTFEPTLATESYGTVVHSCLLGSDTFLFVRFSPQSAMRNYSEGGSNILSQRTGKQ